MNKTMIPMTAPELLAAKMKTIREIEYNLERYGYKKHTKEWYEAYVVESNFYSKFVGEVKWAK